MLTFLGLILCLGLYLFLIVVVEELHAWICNCRRNILRDSTWYRNPWEWTASFLLLLRRKHEHFQQDSWQLCHGWTQVVPDRDACERLQVETCRNVFPNLLQPCDTHSDHVRWTCYSWLVCRTKFRESHCSVRVWCLQGPDPMMTWTHEGCHFSMWCWKGLPMHR